MAENLLIAFLIGTVIIILCVFALFKYRNTRTKKRAKSREQNNALYKIKRRFVNSVLVGIIIGTIIAEFTSVLNYSATGEWLITYFASSIVSSIVPTVVFAFMFGPMFERIKRNLLVRNQDRSIYSILRTFGRIFICIMPFMICVIMGMLGVSKNVAEPLVFFGTFVSVIISIIFLKIRNGNIEKGIREGCKKFPNFESVAQNRITEREIIDCITCDSVETEHNFVIKNDITDVGFSCVNFKTIVGKRGASVTDPAEAVHYKLSKVCKSPIICTFDEEITDSPMPIVETENPAFNNEFTTYCENSVDAFYILTPQIMEQMIEAQKIYKRLVFNFDGDNLFVIIYHDKFKSTLGKKDIDGAFKGVNEMLGYLIFDSIAKTGAHSANAKKAKDLISEETKVKNEAVISAGSSKFKKGLKIGALILGAIIVVNVFFLTLSFCAFNESTVRDALSGTSSSPTTEDISKIQIYLKQKYGQDFALADMSFSSKYESKSSTSVSATFKDINGYSFYAQSYVWNNESPELQFSDDYQSSQYDKIIMQQILATNPNIDDVYFGSGPFTEKFNSIDDMLNKKTDFYFSIYLKDSFGEINSDNALELSKQIVSALNIKDAYLNFYNINDRQKQCAYRYKNGEYYIS